MSLPYDMGNVGDLLKHGVLAEFVRWQCDSGRSFRFFDLFGGEPEGPALARFARRVLALPDGALRAAQIGIDEGRYFGSGIVARNAARNASCSTVQVLTGDRDSERRERLRAAGLTMVDEEFPRRRAGADRYDAYAAFGEIVDILREDDLVLLDPFHEFLPRKARTVVPQMATAAKRAAVLLFALNLEPGNSVGRRFDALLERHLPGAWRTVARGSHPEDRSGGARHRLTAEGDRAMPGTGTRPALMLPPGDRRNRTAGLKRRGVAPYLRAGVAPYLRAGFEGAEPLASPDVRTSGRLAHDS